MNTRIFMTSSSFVLAAAGAFALFAPEELLSLWSETNPSSISILIQLMGALYLAFAMMNWVAKDSAIGGVYARPVSMANFTHFMIGALLLLKLQATTEFNLFMFILFLMYAFYAVCFYWLVFHATGLKANQ